MSQAAKQSAATTFFGRKFFRDKFLCGIFSVKSYLPKSSLAGKVRVRLRVRARIELG